MFRLLLLCDEQFANAKEPSLAYHILTNNATCLPLDVPHREAFEPYKLRGSFEFGLIKSEPKHHKNTYDDVEEEPGNEDDDDNAEE